MNAANVTEKILSTVVATSISTVASATVFIGSMALAPALGLWS